MTGSLDDAGRRLPARGSRGLPAATPASAAASSTDVPVLQAAAALENLAVTFYIKALTLPFVASGNVVVRTFFEKTMAQHQDHADAFNAAATQLGGQVRTGPDPRYLQLVTATLPSLTSPAPVVAFAIVLEDLAAQTHTRTVSQVSSRQLREIFGSVAPVEAQHRSILLVAQALLGAGQPALISVPTDPSALPATTGRAGFPDAFYPTGPPAPLGDRTG